MERFLATACAMDWILELDGVEDFAAPVERRVAAFPDFAEELRMFDTRWLETLGGAIDENLALMRRLKAREHPVYALTNFNAQKFEEARALYPFLDDFDEIVVSGREKTIKPEPRIFEILFERSGRRPQDLLFVDDSPRNVAAAERLGMAAILYAPGVDLARELRHRGALA